MKCIHCYLELKMNSISGSGFCEKCKSYYNREFLKASNPWWTAFYFEFESDPNVLHVTHKYFGALSTFEASDVEHRIDTHFARAHGYKPFPASFTKVAYYGPGEDIRVLVPLCSSSFFDGYLKGQYQTLRATINHFRRDDYPFNPHVTTDSESVHGVLAGYALIRGKEVIHRWT
jgi:hypothetical protein